jgi:hypothetical protein
MQPPPNTRRPRSKVPADQVRQIRDLFASGVPQKVIALQFNRSRACICLIVRNRRHAGGAAE